MTFRAVETEPAVAKIGQSLTADMLSGQHARKDQIEHRGPVVHAARGNAEDGDQCGVRRIECGVLSFGS